MSLDDIRALNKRAGPQVCQFGATVLEHLDSDQRDILNQALADRTIQNTAIISYGASEWGVQFSRQQVSRHRDHTQSTCKWCEENRT